MKSFFRLIGNFLSAAFFLFLAIALSYLTYMIFQHTITALQWLKKLILKYTGIDFSGFITWGIIAIIALFMLVILIASLVSLIKYIINRKSISRLASKRKLKEYIRKNYPEGTNYTLSKSKEYCRIMFLINDYKKWNRKHPFYSNKIYTFKATDTSHIAVAMTKILHNSMKYVDKQDPTISYICYIYESTSIIIKTFSGLATILKTIDNAAVQLLMLSPCLIIINALSSHHKNNFENRITGILNDSDTNDEIKGLRIRQIDIECEVEGKHTEFIIKTKETHLHNARALAATFPSSLNPETLIYENAKFLHYEIVPGEPKSDNLT